MSKVILVTGPAGAGKSTTCEEFAKTSDGIWAYINQDDIRWYIKSGFANPTKSWDDETHKQWELSQNILGDILKRYQNSDVNCIADVFAPKESFDKWGKALEGVNYKLVVLLPDVETAVKRNTQREKESVLKESSVRNHHEWFSEWLGDFRAYVINTTDLSVREVVKRIRSSV